VNERRKVGLLCNRQRHAPRVRRPNMVETAKTPAAHTPSAKRLAAGTSGSTGTTTSTVRGAVRAGRGAVDKGSDTTTFSHAEGGSAARSKSGNGRHVRCRALHPSACCPHLRSATAYGGVRRMARRQRDRVRTHADRCTVVVYRLPGLNMFCLLATLGLGRQLQTNLNLNLIGRHTLPSSSPTSQLVQHCRSV
jgi:hypothetical protein